MKPALRLTLVLALTLVASLLVSACGDAVDGEPASADALGDSPSGTDASGTDASGADANDASPDSATAADSSVSDASDGADTSATALVCTGGAFETPAPEGFEHSASEFTVSVSHPEHSAQDVMVPPGSLAWLPGKFAYGRFSKDLEDEAVGVWLDDCAGWQPLGTVRTDSDGRASTSLDAAMQGLERGRYEVRQVVLGDGSQAVSMLRLLPAGTRLVVIDIDGTLTTADEEVFEDAIDEYFFPVYDGEYVPEAYPGAVELTWALHDKGYELVYLTGRPYWLTRITREWLDTMGFAPGHLHLTDSNGEALPSESGVGAYKRDYLQHLQTLGYVFDHAYGNATTDVFAYAAAGIAPEATWIIGENGGAGGTHALEGGYLEHLAAVAALPVVAQP